MTIEDAVARLEKLAAADQLESSEAAELVERLAAILKTGDAPVAVALESILQGTAHPAVRAALTDALGADEKPRSLEALLTFVKTSELDPDIRGNAGLAASLPEIEKFLARDDAHTRAPTSRPPGRTSRYFARSRWSLVRYHRDTAPDRSGQVTQGG